MRCPKCNAEGAEELADEVDIGVGIQKHVYGAECQMCGPLAICSRCGAWDFEPHRPWCKTED